MNTNRRVARIAHLYRSEKWLKHQYYTLRKSPEEIALAAGCSPMTIYRALKKHGMIK
jgi:DNA-binding CsgD family transcriptional regulator